MYSGSSPLRTLYLTVELLFLFVLIPFLFAFFKVNPVLIIPGLFSLTFITWRILQKDSNYRREYEFSVIKLRLFLPGFLVIGFLLAAVSGIYLFNFEPDNFMFMPRRHTSIWVAVIFLYPIFSGLPQEFIYRRFFFTRYSSLMSEKDLILFSAITFGFMHIIFHNLLAPSLSLAGGYLFARTFSQSRSIIITSIEHGLYGIIIFTTGLHNYFYDGPHLH